MWSPSRTRLTIAAGRRPRWSVCSVSRCGQARTVSLTGESSQIEQTLRLALRLAPIAKRLACTFTTWTEGCPVERGFYWAAGATRRLSSDALEVDARERKVAAAGAARGGDGDLYWEWIENACFKIPLRSE